MRMSVETLEVLDLNIGDNHAVDLATLPVA